MGLHELLHIFETDKTFAAKYQKLSSLDAWLVQANQDGYAITKEELEEFLHKAWNGELSDDELENVTGAASIGIPTAHFLPFLSGDDKSKTRTLPYLSGGHGPNVRNLPYKKDGSKSDVFFV